MDPTLISKLKQLNNALDDRKKAWPNSNELRSQLNQIGEIKTIRRLSTATENLETALELLNLREKNQEDSPSRPKLVAIDGSLRSIDAGYPYTLCLFRANALVLPPNTFLQEAVRVFTPLLPEDEAAVSQVANLKGLQLEEALTVTKSNILANLELEVAIAAAKHLKPTLMLLDGGFLRYQSHASENWRQFGEIVKQHGIIAVGFIKNIATREIASRIPSLSALNPAPYDREILFGLFNQGEYIKITPELRFKGEYYTVFGRLGSEPWPISCDFFPEQSQAVEPVMDFLGAITPSQGRGIPWCLDVIDSKVRIAEHEFQALVSTYLSRDLIAKYFYPEKLMRPI